MKILLTSDWTSYEVIDEVDIVILLNPRDELPTHEPIIIKYYPEPI